METLKVGILLEGSRPVGEGINGALRGFAQIGEEEIQVIAKYLSERELLCEILCSQIGRELDLPVPEPFLLFDKDQKPLFGSYDVGYPNLTHYLSKDSDKELIISKLKGWVHLQAASFFDELILNADRHTGNLLYDGCDFQLIDHGLTLHSSVPPETLPYVWNNQLFTLLVSICKNDIEKTKVSNAGSSWTDKLISNNVISNVISDVKGSKEIIDSLSNFLSVRQNLLKSMINIRAGASQSDFLNA